MRAALVLATALLLGACYAYTPITTLPTSPEARVRLELTDAGTAQMAAQVGPGIGSIEGRVAGADADSIRLRTVATTTRTGVQSFWNGEVVVVPRSSVANLTERRLARGRSILLGGSALAIGLVVGATASGALGGGGRPRPGPPPSQK